MTPIDAVVLRLEEKDCGVAGVSIFYGADTDVPGVATGFLTLAEPSSNPSVNTHNAGSLLAPGIQVTARADDYGVAAALATKAFEALGGGDDANKIANLLIGDVFFLWMRPTQVPFQLPLDANSRNRKTFNLNLLVRGPDAARPESWMQHGGWFQR